MAKVIEIAVIPENLSALLEQIDKMQAPCSLSIKGHLIPFRDARAINYFRAGADLMWEIISDRDTPKRLIAHSAMSGWAVIIEKHVVPLDDEREHVTDVSCWCDPTQDIDHDEYLYIHHSADGREADEAPRTSINA